MTFLRLVLYFIYMSDATAQCTNVNGQYRSFGNPTENSVLTLSDIFDAGNGYAREGINVVSLQKHPSMSVGDIAVDLYLNTAVMCMPAGWKELDLKLTLA